MCIKILAAEKYSSMFGLQKQPAQVNLYNIS